MFQQQGGRADHFILPGNPRKMVIEIRISGLPGAKINTYCIFTLKLFYKMKQQNVKTFLKNKKNIYL